MNTVKISDASMRQLRNTAGLSFKNKLELAKLLDRLGAAVIELEPIERVKADSLLIKSIASAVKESSIAVPVGLNAESAAAVWNALKIARKPRLQVCAPVSTVQMEYLYHQKPAAMLEIIRNMVTECRKYTTDVEFVADDATRSDEAFLYDALRTALEAGAATVTVCDTAGSMLPEEFSEFIGRIIAAVPELENATLGVSCSNALSMADACAIAAVRAGAREIKAAACPVDMASLSAVSRILAAKGGSFDVVCKVRTVEMKRVMAQIQRLCLGDSAAADKFAAASHDKTDDVLLTAHDDMETVLKAVEKLGYDLSEEDGKAVWEAFCQVAARKEEIGAKELDAIAASAAMQVPAAYTLESFVINSGNIITATAHVTLKKDGALLNHVALGDGPIDAAFQALEQIAGRHIELDDFQIHSVTEGHEAMGETVVRLMYNGKLYAGRGISTDIVGASIRAYVNALNRIVYEEAEA